MSGCHPTSRHWPGIADRIKLNVKGLVDGMDPNAPWTDLPIAMLDLETTGFSEIHDRVLDVGIAICKYGHVKSKQRWLINPGMAIPAESTAVHKITDEKVKDSPRFADVAPFIAAFMRGCIPAAYNADFDRKFLFAEFARMGADSGIADDVMWLDPLIWSREIYSHRKRRNLEEMALNLGVFVQAGHGAMEDADMTGQVMYRLAEEQDLLKGEGAKKVPTTYGALISWQRELKFRQQDTMRYWR